MANKLSSIYKQYVKQQKNKKSTYIKNFKDWEDYHTKHVTKIPKGETPIDGVDWVNWNNHNKTIPNKTDKLGFEEWSSWDSFNKDLKNNNKQPIDYNMHKQWNEYMDTFKEPNKGKTSKPIEFDEYVKWQNFNKTRSDQNYKKLSYKEYNRRNQVKKKKELSQQREAPVAEAPVAEAPVAETPVVEAPVVETPVVETPVVETPVVETDIDRSPPPHIVENNNISPKNQSIKEIKQIIGDASTHQEAISQLKTNVKDVTQLEEYINVLEQNQGNFNFKSTKKNNRTKITNNNAKELTETIVEEQGEQILKDKNMFSKVFNSRAVNIATNGFFAVNEFKEAKEAGYGNIRSLAKAGKSFVAGEVFGLYTIPLALAKSAPKAIVGAGVGLQQQTRQMNSVSRLQTFGDTYFQDTQPLATMRQSGMEMAKMSQYNLQQSIMGNEAQYMHKL